MDLATVESCGLATVQDRGRHRYAQLGVPVAGALHRERYGVATTLVQGVTTPDDRAATVPAIELLAGRLVLRFHVATQAVATGPARCRTEGSGPDVVPGVVVRLMAGDLLVVEHAGRGPVYLAVAGWTAPRVLGSAATDTFSRLGGAVVERGFVLTGEVPRDSGRVGWFWRPVPDEAGPVRVVPVGEWRLPGEWRAASTSRSGLRLVGGDAPVSGSTPSLPVLPGAVQLTPAGEAIVLGPDGGVTGGYPVAGVVATVDLDRLSLLVPGDVVRFRPVDAPTAAALAATRRERVRQGFGHPDHAR